MFPPMRLSDFSVLSVTVQAGRTRQDMIGQAGRQASSQADRQTNSSTIYNKQGLTWSPVVNNK